MSFHPNEVQRRARTASVLLVATFALLVSAFFRTQVLRNAEYVLQSEENRLREVPLPAPRGTIFDRNGKIIAENVVGYSVSLLAPTEDSLRSAMTRLSTTIPLTAYEMNKAVQRFRRAPNRPTVILADASFDIVSVLEEHRVEFPGLIIQSSPKRFYPESTAVAAFVGYVGEITENELNSPEYRERGYKAGQQIGKKGLEKQYEDILRGSEGTRFVEVDARGRVVREAGARQDVSPQAAEPLHTNIDLDLQKYAAEVFGDSIQGGVVALDPKTGAVLALHSAPSYDPNRFIGGIPADYWKALNEDPRKPLYNKALQGKYPPASTWKLATSILGLRKGIVTLDSRMPQSCTGGMQYGSRYFRCWDKRGHGSVTLQQAIEKSCDVFFYQLGLRLTLREMIAGGLDLGFRSKSGIDLPEERRPDYPTGIEYYNKLYGPRGWSNAVVLNLSIGQGENSQTVTNMAYFYTALATDGSAAKPEIVRRKPERKQIFQLTGEQMDGLRRAMAGVVSGRGTAGSAQIQGVVLAGKTGTAQNSHGADHAWFVGFAPAEDPKIVVAVMVEFGEHGYFAARIASKIIERYLKQPTQIQPEVTEGE
jgi:penicillin-binding protein 2